MNKLSKIPTCKEHHPILVPLLESLIPFLGFPSLRPKSVTFTYAPTINLCLLVFHAIILNLTAVAKSNLNVTFLSIETTLLTSVQLNPSVEKFTGLVAFSCDPDKKQGL
uniref:Uncharacterized protein n=1 Tax=Cannabis sativa TaxID=3483 RepID=A0A803RBG1_CANSA